MDNIRRAVISGSHQHRSGSPLDIPGLSVSSGLLAAVSPGGVLSVEGAGFEAAVEDADEAVGQLAQGGVVALAAGAELVVVGAGSGGCGQGAEGLLVQGVGEAGVAGVAGQDGLLLARGAGDR